MESTDYRQIMRGHAGAVAVIATGNCGQRTGLTATAVCSLSDSPPTILICVNRNASAHSAIRASGFFSVNWLSAHQDSLAACFAGQTGRKAEERFCEGEWTTLETGAPVLGDSLASLDCELVQEHEHATHSIFIGRVHGARINEGEDPLLYYAGRFSGLTALAPCGA